MKWAIYNRDGKLIHESVTEYNGDGNVVYQDTLEYSGKWMGERALTVTVKSAYPIDFQIGDYIDYRGERFTINYDPTVIKKARRGTYGEGFTYESVKFSSYSNELTMMRFHDWVLSDNTLHYTSLPDFSFYAKDVDDLVDRLQACADRWCKANGRKPEEYWLFYTLKNNTSGTSDAGQWQTTHERTVQRAKDILECAGVSSSSAEYSDFVNKVQETWEEMYGLGEEYADSRDDERYVRSISISQKTVWDGLALIKSEFGLNFIVRGRNVFVGTAGIPTAHLFTYGKGNGLYEVERQADSSQLVVTRLHAYGSNENLPTRYYATLNARPYVRVATVLRNYVTTDYSPDTSGDPIYIVSFRTDLAFESKYFSNASELHIAIGDYSIRAHAVKQDDGTMSIASFYYTSGLGAGQWTFDGTDIETFKLFQAVLTEGAIVTIITGAKQDAWPTDHIISDTDNLPDNMAINFLMLPGFPNHSLAEICRVEYDEDSDTTNYYITKPGTSTEWMYNEASGEYKPRLDMAAGIEVLFHSESGKHVVTFSADKYDPYIVSPNAETLGIMDGDISCTEDNDDNGLEKVYPTIEEMTDQEAGTGSTGARLDEVVTADTIEDNGVWPSDKSTTVPGFHIYLKELGFNVRQAAKDAGGSEMEINMKDGFNGGRTFKVASVTVVNSSDAIKTAFPDAAWDLNCSRVLDNDRDLYFPYSYPASVAKSETAIEEAGMTGAYQILAGDHFVLTGLYVYDLNYVWAASVRLLRKAIHWLCKNDYTRYVYNPKIDDLFMAREASDAAKSGRTSLHDAITEGDILLFKDSDLLIDGGVYIDQLTIKENGNNGIPTYTVTLRDEVTVGTLQRLQSKVDSIANDIRTGSVSGVTSPAQVEAMLQAYGTSWFLSKTRDDATPYKLTAGELEVQGALQADGGAEFGGYATGLTGTGGQIDAAGYGELRGLRLWEWLEVPELRYNKVSVYTGIRWDTNGGGVVESAEPAAVKMQTAAGSAFADGVWRTAAPFNFYADAAKTSEAVWRMAPETYTDSVTSSETCGALWLKLEAGEAAAVSVGDLCMGIWHDKADEGGNATADADSWFAADTTEQATGGIFSFRGFKTVYFQITDIPARDPDGLDNADSHYVLYAHRAGYAESPFAGMHFAQRGNVSDAERQGFVYTTTRYTMMLDRVSSWGWSADNIMLIQGRLAGFSLPATNAVGTTYTKRFTGHGLVFGNAYMYGTIDQFNRADVAKIAWESTAGETLAAGMETQIRLSVLRGSETLPATGFTLRCGTTSFAETEAGVFTVKYADLDATAAATVLTATATLEDLDATGAATTLTLTEEISLKRVVNGADGAKGADGTDGAPAYTLVVYAVGENGNMIRNHTGAALLEAHLFCGTDDISADYTAAGGTFTWTAQLADGAETDLVAGTDFDTVAGYEATLQRISLTAAQVGTRLCLNAYADLYAHTSVFGEGYWDMAGTWYALDTWETA